MAVAEVLNFSEKTHRTAVLACRFELNSWDIVMMQMKEQEIRRQFRAAVNIQNKQYKLLKEQLLTRTSKAEQKAMLAKLKEEQDRRLSMLSDQYEQSISEVKQHQHVSIECMIHMSAH